MRDKFITALDNAIALPSLLGPTTPYTKAVRAGIINGMKTPAIMPAINKFQNSNAPTISNPITVHSLANRMSCPITISLRLSMRSLIAPPSKEKINMGIAKAILI